MATVGQAYVQIIPSAEGITGKIKSVLDPEANSAGESAGSTIGQQIASFATKAIAALGVGKAISSAITDGMDFETTMAKASTLFAGTADEFAALQSEIMGLSSTYGVAASEFAEAAYSAESASVPMGNLGSMLEGSAKLAVSGFTDIDTALSATAKTMNAYGMMSDDVAATQENMEKVQRVLIQTQNKGITTVGELGASLAQVTPTAASFSVSFEQVGAALAGMTAQGTPTAQATTQLNSLIAELGKNGTIAANNLTKAAEGTEYAGMSFTEMMDAGLTLNDVLDMMKGLADENGLAMVDMFSSIEAGKAAMSINSSDFVENLAAMSTEADVVGEAFGTMSDTTQFKLDQFKTSLQNIGIEAFSASADVLCGALEGVSTVLELIKPHLETMGQAFRTLIEAFGQAVGELLGLDEGFSATEAIAAALSTAIDALAGVFQFLADHMDAVIPILTGVVAGFTALKAVSAAQKVISGVGGALGLLASPAGIAVAAIAAVVAAGVAIYKNWDTIKEKAAALKEALSQKWTEIKESVSQAWENVKTSVSDAVEGIRTAATEKWEGIKTAISDKISGIKDAVSEKFAPIGEIVAGTLESTKEYVGEKLGHITATFREHGGGIQGLAAAAIEGVKQYYSVGYDALNGLTGEKLEEMRSKVAEKFNAAKEKATEAMENIRAKAQEKFDAAKTAIQTATEGALTATKEKFTSMYSAVSEKVINIYTTAKEKFNSMKDAILSAVGNLISAIPGKLNEIKTAFATKFGEMATAAFNWGADIIMGIVNGITSMIGKVRDAAGSVANAIREFIHFSEPDVGPLSDFHTYMPDMIKMLAKGITEGAPVIRKAMESLTLEMKPDVVRDYQIRRPAAVQTAATGTTAGGVTINVYGAEGQSVDDLSNVIMQKLTRRMQIEGMAFS